MAGTPDENPPVSTVVATETDSAPFQINNTKLYVPVVNLSINDNIKFLENIKKGFTKITSWKKHRSEIITIPKENNLHFMIDPTFRNINRLFVLSLNNGDDGATRNSFDKNCMPLVEIKYFGALIDNKSFFNQPVKNKQEAYEKLVEMSRKNNYTTGKLLDHLYQQSFDKFIDIDLSRQTNTSIPKQINFTEKQQKSYFKLFIEFVKRNRII